MALPTGSRLGIYEIVGLIGAGGMGEVYRARDTKLGRDIAIKVLPESVATDPERLARFEREAKVLAALNHPHIAHVHGFEDSTSVPALVMELIEGPTLADRIAQGPIATDEAMRIATQVAEALEAAHEAAIIHRDLKPANIKLRSDGTAKVLDFGLAKLGATGATGASGATGSLSPEAVTSPALTMQGMLLGTAAYMSPEQVKGHAADKRSDIWAFGCVLYEMLTAKRAFPGDDVSDTLAAVLRGEPAWSQLPPDVSPAVRLMLQRCLEKDRRQRIADASTIRFVINTPARALVAAAGTPDHVVRKRRWRTAVSMTATALAASAVTATALWMLRAQVAPQLVTRFPVQLQEPQSFGGNGLPLVAISPDGSQMVYAALTPRDGTSSTQSLYIRSMSETSVKPIAGTEVPGGVVGAPVFSPDSQSIVFYSAPITRIGIYDQMRGVLKRISAHGGAAETLCDVELPLGVSWSGNTVLFAQASKGILRVRDSGGDPEQIVSIADDEDAQGPQMLPGNDAILFALLRGIAKGSSPTDESWDKADIVVHSISSGTRKTLIRGGSDVRYLSSGHLVYAVAGTLRAVGFDAKRLEVVGKPAPVLEGVGRSRFGPLARTGSAHFSVSASGSLVYIPGPVAPAASLQNLAFIDRTGGSESLRLTPARYEYPRVSPDGKQVAVGISEGTESNIWTYDLSGGSPLRQLTFGGRNRLPVWSRDGRYISFQSERDGDRAIFWQRADGTAPAERLTKPEPGVAHVPDSWSPTSDQLLVDIERESKFSLAILDIRNRTLETIDGVQSATITPAAAFSPDGRWVVYHSDEAPTPRIFIRPFAATGTAFPVANGRGPRFSSDGAQVIYSVANRMFAVAVRTDPKFSVSNPVFLNENQLRTVIGPSPLHRNWDLIHDNRYVGVIDETPAATVATRRVEVVVNWHEDLKHRVPVK